MRAASHVFGCFPPSLPVRLAVLAALSASSMLRYGLMVENLMMLAVHNVEPTCRSLGVNPPPAGGAMAAPDPTQQRAAQPPPSQPPNPVDPAADRVRQAHFQVRSMAQYAVSFSMVPHGLHLLKLLYLHNHCSAPEHLYRSAIVECGHKACMPQQAALR